MYSLKLSINCEPRTMRKSEELRKQLVYQTEKYYFSIFSMKFLLCVHHLLPKIKTVSKRLYILLNTVAFALTSITFTPSK